MESHGLERWIAGALAASALPVAAFAGVVASPIPQFEPGLYRVVPVDPDSRASEKPRLICAPDADALFHLRHNDAPGCQNRLVQPGGNGAVVNYSCPARGWGRTELRRELPGLYQLDTQGISGRDPFAMRAEVRRVGDCPGARMVPGR